MEILKFGLFSDLVTYFCDLLNCPGSLQDPVTQYICGSNLVMICQSVRELCMKMR